LSAAGATIQYPERQRWGHIDINLHKTKTRTTSQRHRVFHSHDMR
jgi:hypothetical protein